MPWTWCLVRVIAPTRGRTASASDIVSEMSSLTLEIVGDTLFRVDLTG